MTTTNFEEIKEEILKRAHKAGACAKQYGRAYQSKSTEELMQVVKDNFHWACDYNVITPDLIERYREEFAANEIYLNVSTKRGYLLCDNATVEAWGNATVKACDNATVKAWGNSYCCSYYVIECKLSDKAIYRVISENTIYFADDTIKFKKQ